MGMLAALVNVVRDYENELVMAAASIKLSRLSYPFQHRMAQYASLGRFILMNFISNCAFNSVMPNYRFRGRQISNEGYIDSVLMKWLTVVNKVIATTMMAMPVAFIFDASVRQYSNYFGLFNAAINSLAGFVNLHFLTLAASISLRRALVLL